jgi:hypothetical protein
MSISQPWICGFKPYSCRIHVSSFDNSEDMRYKYKNLLTIEINLYDHSSKY